MLLRRFHEGKHGWTPFNAGTMRIKAIVVQINNQLAGRIKG
jgi:hypothetical protein